MAFYFWLPALLEPPLEPNQEHSLFCLIRKGCKVLFHGLPLQVSGTCHFFDWFMEWLFHAPFKPRRPTMSTPPKKLSEVARIWQGLFSTQVPFRTSVLSGGRGYITLMDVQFGFNFSAIIWNPASLFHGWQTRNRPFCSQIWAVWPTPVSLL